MLQQVYDAVTNLPAIMQAIVGSALFSFLMFAGPRLYSQVSERVTHITKSRRKKYLVDEMAKLKVGTAKDYSEAGAYVSVLVYRALNSLFKALIWLALGQMTSSINPVFGFVGYLGAFYYFFGGLNTVNFRRDTEKETTEEKEAKLNALKVELEALNKNLGNTSRNATAS